MSKQNIVEQRWKGRETRNKKNTPEAETYRRRPEMEARIRRWGAGSLVGRNRDRSRLDRNDWCWGNILIKKEI
jgi:hypothetical protein